MNKNKMVICYECGCMAIPYFMLSVTTDDGLCWLCDDCYEKQYQKQREEEINNRY